MNCVVTATRDQLEDIGISRKITNKTVEYVRELTSFPEKYSLIRVDPPAELQEIMTSFLKTSDGLKGAKLDKEEYSIPKKWLKFPTSCRDCGVLLEDDNMYGICSPCYLKEITKG